MVSEATQTIDRETAWKAWEPYGERLHGELDGSLGPDILPDEAACVAFGADEADRRRIFQHVPPSCRATALREQIDALSNVVANGASPQLIDLLLLANDKQVKAASEARDEAVDQVHTLLRVVGGSALELAGRGDWAEDKAEMVQARLHAPDRTPLLQYTPVTTLEWARLAADEREHTTGTLRDSLIESVAITPSFDSGAIVAPVVIGKGARRAEAHQQLHEYMHVLSGLWLVLQAGQERPKPSALVVGIAPQGNKAASLSVKYGGNFGWNEALVEDETHALMNTKSSLRAGLRPASVQASRYRVCLDRLHAMRMCRPVIAEEMARAALVEASPAAPDAKEAALAQLNAVADREFGIQGAFNRLVWPGKTSGAYRPWVRR